MEGTKFIFFSKNKGMASAVVGEEEIFSACNIYNTILCGGGRAPISEYVSYMAGSTHVAGSAI